MSKDINKILLAYSGGLDTSISISWLKEEYDAEVIAYSANVGQGGDWEAIKNKALETGAIRVYIDDLEQEFVEDFAFESLKANALYEGKYPLATALARPLIAEKMVEIARKEDVDALAHGCTAKGNDQVRFDVAFRTLAPDLEIIAPLREWDFKTRIEELEYAKANDIPVEVTKDSPYSIDANLWGISVECGKLEDPWEEPPTDSYQWTKAPEDTPDQAAEISITFDEGIPIKVNDKYMSPVELVKKLNSLGADYGIGRIDMVENRLVGIKSREIYEAPAATILTEAHSQLEALTLDRDTLHYKQNMANKYAELIYNGLWYSPLKKAMDAFIDSTQTRVNGEVKLKLYKGQVIVSGRKSAYSLYQEDLATYGEEDDFDHSAAPGFIKLWGLPTQVAAGVERKNKNTVKLKNAIK
ncbi:MAG: argininosuccinate synthase [Bacillota bacterium]